MNQTRSDLSKEKLYEEFSAVVSDTEDLLRAAAAFGGDKANGYKEDMEKGLAAASEKLARIREASVDHAKSAARATDRYVHDNPWQTIGMIAALSAITGMVAGALIARR